MKQVNTLIAEALGKELPGLWRFALKLTFSLEAASSLVEQTCSRAFEQPHCFSANKNYHSWLFKVQYCCWHDDFRKRHLQIQLLKQTDLYPVSVENRLEGPSTIIEICDFIDQLPEAQRLVVLLAKVEGFTYRETASILDLPIATVMSRLVISRVRIGRRRQKSINVFALNSHVAHCKSYSWR